MKHFSKLMIILSLCFGCTNELKEEEDLGQFDAADIDLDLRDGVSKKFEVCSGLDEADCFSNGELCDWFEMRQVRFENMCVFGREDGFCAPNMSTAASEVFINDSTKEVVLSPVGFGDSWSGWSQCRGEDICDCRIEGSFESCTALNKVDCESTPEFCQWVAMQKVSFENNVCVAGATFETCTPNQSTGLVTVFINKETGNPVVSPKGFGGSWAGWEECQNLEVCDCSSCLGAEPGQTCEL